jgi:hypothetical protein
MISVPRMEIILSSSTDYIKFSNMFVVVCEQYLSLHYAVLLAIFN